MASMGWMVPNLVIGRHDADEGRIWAQGFFDTFGTDESIF